MVQLSINGHRLWELIDVPFYGAEERLALQVRRSGREFTIGAERRYDEPLGMEFAHPTFDTVRRCNNRCEFCFVAQMPLGLRRSLYVEDDEYRYSFLFGNYVTLTNLDEADWERIGEQHHVAGLPAEVVPVVNRFFGETVTVAGLLTGRDVVAQLRERDLGDVVLLPAAMFGGPEGQSLDEMRPQEIGEALGRPVLVAGHPVCRPFTACRA